LRFLFFLALYGQGRRVEQRGAGLMCQELLHGAVAELPLR
jgi:hypothetical protein